MLKPKILVVEDDNLQAEMVIRALNKLSVAVTILRANSGTQGWELAQSELPTVVLLDLALPTMSGVEVAERIRQDERFEGTALVAMTADNISEQDFQHIRSLFDDFLEKPFHMDELRQLVEGFL